MELLSPAGNFESLIMAVQNGADAVYVGGSLFSARSSAKNFDREELRNAVDYCHLRGVKLYLACNTLVKETEIGQLCEYLAFLWQIGVDSAIVQDWGVLKLLRDNLPEFPVHASTQMTIHNSGGVKALEQAGVKRVVLARECGKKEIAAIRKQISAELEIFVHGALCMSYSGQCLMSSLIGGRSGNRGGCAQPCRLPYTLYCGEQKVGKTLPLLSPKDLCLVHQLPELKEAGADSLKIEGRMKSPEYVGMVTRVYREALTEGADQKSVDDMLAFFSRGGSGTGYFYGKQYKEMMDYGERSKISADKALEKKVQQTAVQEYRKRPLDFYFSAQAGLPVSLTAMSGQTFLSRRIGLPAEAAVNRPTAEERVREQLAKLGGTPFFAEHMEFALDDSVAVSIKEINRLRREAVEDISRQIQESCRRKPKPVLPGQFPPGQKKSPELVIQVTTRRQLEAVREMGIESVCMPYELFLQNGLPEDVCVLPAVNHEEEALDLTRAKKVVANNIGQIAAAEGKIVYGGQRLNVFNTQAVAFLHELGLSSVILSPELNLRELSALTKEMGVLLEVVGYGRLELMLMENCVIKSAHRCGCKEKRFYLRDRMGERFPLGTENCRNIVYNAKPIYMADKLRDIKSLQIDRIRLNFTVENPDLCCIIIEEYRKALRGEFVPKPEMDFTRGHFYRGVT